MDISYNLLRNVTAVQISTATDAASARLPQGENRREPVVTAKVSRGESSGVVKKGSR